MKLSNKIVWDESFGQGSYNFYKQAKEIERQINNDDSVLSMVIRVNNELYSKITEILEYGENDNIGRSVNYIMRTIGRYFHRQYHTKDGHIYFATIDLVLKKFILEEI